jgi:hypothetical protein
MKTKSTSRGAFFNSRLLIGFGLCLIGVLLGLVSTRAGKAPATGVAKPAQAKPTAVELESWRKTILKTPRPKAGCFTATYPETKWREVPCKTPPHKLFLPSPRGGTRIERVGGSTKAVGVDFSPNVTGRISEAEGSFDNVTGVTSGSDAEYSLQLNTEFFGTATCSNYAPCQGWEQFVYDSPSGSAYIQYWLIQYGPAGTECPAPRSASCDGSHVFSDGWCPLNFPPPYPSDVYCVANSTGAAPAGVVPITSLDQLKLTGTATGVFGGSAKTDSVTVWVGSTPWTATGSNPKLFSNAGNYFPDLGSHWQIAEFNVFGHCCGIDLHFNAGSTIVVHTSVDTGTASAPGVYCASFTAESNNLTLVDLTPPVPQTGMQSLVFKESNAPGSKLVSCPTPDPCQGFRDAYYNYTPDPGMNPTAVLAERRRLWSTLHTCEVNNGESETPPPLPTPPP